MIPPAPDPRLERPWFGRRPIASFLIALSAYIVVTPFLEMLRYGKVVESTVLSAVLVAPLLTLGGRARMLAMGMMLVAPAVACKWLSVWWPERVPPPTYMLPGIAYLLLLMRRMLQYVLRARRVDSEVLCAGVAGYLLMGVLWSFAYIVVASVDPGAFLSSSGQDSGPAMRGFTAFYFSFITLTTVGYGDIAPLSSVSRMLAMMEAMCGTFYVTVLIARLVSMYSASPPPADPPGKPPAEN